MKWTLAIMAALIGLARPALAQEREVTIDLTFFRGVVGYAREFRPGTLAGGELGIGVPYIDLTLAPPGEGGEKKPDFGELLHAGVFVRRRVSPRFDVDAGVRASLGGVWPCRVSDCWPSPFMGAYVQPVVAWRRIRFGARLTAGWIGESWEGGSAGSTFVVGLSPFMVRLTFR